MLSVIVPIYNDFQGDWIKNILDRLCHVKGIEVICVDSSDTAHRRDGALEEYTRYIKEINFKIVHFETLSRGARLQAGIDASAGTTILLHHPRSLVSLEGLEWLRDHAEADDLCPSWPWGGFTHKFDLDHVLLRITSWYSNKVRPRFGGIVYLDHCIFFHRSALGSSRIPPVEIFEDTELSLLLLANTSTKPRIAPYTSTTSAVRFSTNGIIRQIVLNQWLKVCYWLGGLGGDGVVMNAAYERGLNLNGAAALASEGRSIQSNTDTGVGAGVGAGAGSGGKGWSKGSILCLSACGLASAGLLFYRHRRSLPALNNISSLWGEIKWFK